jgi:hypoxanthine phosphoribosyltransferase
LRVVILAINLPQGILTLLFKKGMSKLDFDIKYIGFKIPDKFVVGYGTDYAYRYRNLKEIFVLKN